MNLLAAGVGKGLDLLLVLAVGAQGVLVGLVVTIWPLPRSSAFTCGEVIPIHYKIDQRLGDRLAAAASAACPGASATAAAVVGDPGDAATGAGDLSSPHRHAALHSCQMS